MAKRKKETIEAELKRQKALCEKTTAKIAELQEELKALGMTPVQEAAAKRLKDAKAEVHAARKAYAEASKVQQ